MKLLWLASWYPAENAPYNGDFIQRHANAVALYNDVDVIHVTKDLNGSITRSEKRTVRQTGRLRETIIYYFAGNKIPVLSKIISDYRYRKCFKKTIGEYIAQNGKPDLIHVHIAMKAGLAAMWAKKKYNIPYVVTEHWTGYLPEAKPSIRHKSFYFRAATKKILENALSVSAVSSVLAKALTKFSITKPVVIPNVVDTNIFNYRHVEADPFRFVHISGLDEQKDPQTLFEGFAKAAKREPRLQLDVFGPLKPELKQIVVSLGIEKNVSFHGEVVQAVLAEKLRGANALILPSRFETFGCVVIEANASGAPVIVSDLPVLHEIVQEGINGSFIPVWDANALADSILAFTKETSRFARQKVAEQAASTFSYEMVGKQFNDWYASLLSDTGNQPV